MQNKQEKTTPVQKKHGRPGSAGKEHREPGNARKADARRIDNKWELFATGLFFVAVFAAMIGYLGYFTATSRQDMVNNSYNSRQEIFLSQNYRGSIYSRDGEVLAETVLDERQNESTPIRPLVEYPTMWANRSAKG